MRTFINSPALYFVTPDIKEQPLLDLVLAAVKGGATIVQFRNKAISDKDYIENARLLQRHLSEINVPLIINDRVHLVQEVGAAGAHIGQYDLSVPRARSLIGPNCLLGLSIESVEDAHRARQWIPDLDYVAVSPVFLTSTKLNISRPLGLEGVRVVKKTLPELPIAGIGGINLSNIREVREAGAKYLCAISAIADALNPQEAAAALLARLRQ